MFHVHPPNQTQMHVDLDTLSAQIEICFNPSEKEKTAVSRISGYNPESSLAIN